MNVEPFYNKIKQLMQLHYNRLLEKDRHHYAALYLLKLGRGGWAIYIIMAGALSSLID